MTHVRNNNAEYLKCFVVSTLTENLGKRPPGLKYSPE